MSVLDLAAYKPVPATLGDANQIANGFQAIQTCINALDNNNFAAGKIFDLTKLMQGAAVLNSVLRWDGANWSKTSTVLVDDANSAVTIGNGPATTPVLSILGAIGGRQNQLEWGNANNANFRNTLGNDNGSGQAFLAFYGEHGTNASTYRARGTRSSIIEPDGTGGFRFGNVAAAATDNQAFVALATLGNTGVFTTTDRMVATVPGGSTGFMYNPGTGGIAFQSIIQGEANNRFAIDVNGRLSFGPGGATAPNVSLQRAGDSALTIQGSGAAVASLTIDSVSGTNNAQILLAARNAGTLKQSQIYADIGGNLVLNTAIGGINYFQVNGVTTATLDTTGFIAAAGLIVRGDLKTSAASVTTARAGGAAAALPANPVRYLAMIDENGNRMYVPAYS